MRHLLTLPLLVGSLATFAVAAPAASEGELSEQPLTPEQARALEEAFVEIPWQEGPAAAPTPVATHAGLLRLGERKLESGDYQMALIAFEQVGRETNLKSEREAALAGMARTYRRSGDLVKAVATYERLIHDHAGALDTPRYLLELGRTLRAVGAPKLAISRFYSVIHTVIKVPPGQADTYLQLARTAQYEIADTHFQMGNFEEAARFFSRLNLLDLAPADRARAEFKAAEARARAGDPEAAVAAFRRFVERNPQDELNAEARFQLAALLHKLGRPTESLNVTLELLRREQVNAGIDQPRWIYWQRRTGNQLANEFYQQGDFASALAIYTRLVDLSPEPRWRLPVLYQMALCQERLMQTGLARDLYEEIRQAAAQSADFAELERMAVWRLGQLAWSEEIAQRVEKLALPAQVAVAP
jgi:tetratricopeptide (TPR) repeat protein